jgi:hypothetical protein
MKIKSWKGIPELEDVLRKLDALNKKIKEECWEPPAEVVMPYLRRIPKNRNENLAKGRQSFQKAINYNVT